MAAVRFLVSGRVQGVFYRASAREQALALGLTGYAKNLADGRVEVVAAGSPISIDALERWLWQGPSAARVDQVVREACDMPDVEGFRTR
ncbi:acylphosphatase [Dyella japonica]|uniref:acylphosphatase n=1 Tax=Dyella japonica A8 TaxID=1217721 RepID=A0A075KAA7_9GAMM|nr:acylphosphatase [Dyella japonica]AIF49133.1 acylphosphatase [Dyella japonica A8]